MRTLTIGAVLVLAAGLAACGDDAGTSEAGGTIEVTATDTECKVARTEAAAGTVTFTVTNKGSKVTEFYVYAAGGVTACTVIGTGAEPGDARRALIPLCCAHGPTAITSAPAAHNALRIS